MAKGRGPNNVTYDCKTSIMSVYEALGGAEEMLKWARRNQTEFYKILAKIVPKDLSIKSSSITVHIGLNEADKQPLNAPDKSELTQEAITSVH